MLIYDPNIEDAEMLRALDTRARHGVRVRISEVGIIVRRRHGDRPDATHKRGSNSRKNYSSDSRTLSANELLGP